MLFRYVYLSHLIFSVLHAVAALSVITGRTSGTFGNHVFRIGVVCNAIISLGMPASWTGAISDDGGLGI